MRLRRLDLTRYGKFTDYSIDFGPADPGKPDLHIIYGLNEAGKSTALSAYLDLLFGIEERSRYNFLHAYAAMQIGGVLEFDGRQQELIRLKQRNGSLLDAQRQPLNEALLGAPLAGLSRDAYRTMFSLDDETLEEGGNAIIASKGDLGELLFSASAGLADVSQMLASAADEADAIYKKRARSTEIAVLKQTLADLKARRDEMDTAASAHAALTAALAQADKAYGEAIAQRGAAKSRHDEIARLLRAAPLSADYARLRHELAELGDGPLPPAEWAAEMPRLMQDETRLATQIAGTREDLARAEAEIAAIAVEDKLLAEAHAIAALADGLARYTTAAEDLPRRKLALAGHQAGLAATLTALGQAGHPEPHKLLLAAPLIGTLRELIEARSGIDATLATAQREIEQARDGFERASAELESGDSAPDDSRFAGIEAALLVLRRSDHRASMRVAERALPAAERRASDSFARLKPWRGEGEELRAISLPGARQMAAWRAEANAIDKRRAEQGDKLRDLQTKLGEDEARLAAIRDAAGAIDDAEAQRLRSARDAAWAGHVKTLDAASAAAFAELLAQDDALGLLRLSKVQDLSDLRLLAQAIAVSRAGVARQTELQAEAQGEDTALRQAIRAEIDGVLTLHDGDGVNAWLDQIETWERARSEALAAWDGLEETRGNLAEASAEATREIAQLAASMGLDADEMAPDSLIQWAETTLAQGGAARAKRDAAQAALRERERDLQVRQRQLEAAKAKAAEWESAWQAGLAGTWFGETATGVGAVRELLKALADLPGVLRECVELERRIDTMGRDQTDFLAALTTIFSDLGEVFDPAGAPDAARALTARLAAAKRDAALKGQKSGERERLAKILHDLERELEAHAASTAQMTGFFGVTGLADVSLKLEQAAGQRRLLSQITALGQQLAAEMRAASVEDALAALTQADLSALEGEADVLAAELENLDERLRTLYADKARAADRLEAVGGDDAVARIEAERRTVLLDIEDKALRFLRLKAGGLVAARALVAYRDKHRSSMMNRASDAFRLITRGEYSGLAAQPDGDKETLIGLTRAGGSKLATAMSKGTQFQLYLALRLAGYQEFALARPSVPFIADDIMETFDEPRSEEVFRLFGEMAGIGQVIYLTHHRHLCDLAREVIPGVKVHELGA